MTKYAVIIALLILCLCPQVSVAAENQRAVGVVPKDVPEVMDKAKEGVCDCCQKCKAAKSSIESEEDEDGEEGDGCADCCARCGKKLAPETEERPPEIIKERIPPEIKEKK